MQLHTFIYTNMCMYVGMDMNKMPTYLKLCNNLSVNTVKYCIQQQEQIIYFFLVAKVESVAEGNCKKVSEFFFA